MIYYRRILFFGLLAALFLAGCSKPAHWYGKDITNLMPPLKFHLTGENGKPITQDKFAGKSVMLFFGYTSCPDVCPAKLSRLGQAYAALPASAQKNLAILFVSVDPKRDTPAKLKKYTAFFGKGIFGATGTQKQLKALVKRYRTSYTYGKPDADGNYVVNHGSGIYGFGKKGYIHLLIMDKQSIKHLTADMATLANL